MHARIHYSVITYYAYILPRGQRAIDFLGNNLGFFSWTSLSACLQEKSGIYLIEDTDGNSYQLKILVDKNQLLMSHIG